MIKNKKGVMRNFFKPMVFVAVLFFAAMNTSQFVFAQEFNKDISISEADVQIPSKILKGDKIRIYATVHNNSEFDLSGVVKFFDERKNAYIGTDMPISALARKTDDVFVDWHADIVGENRIAIRIIPWDSSGDNPDNNKVVKKVYVNIDTDKDGIFDNVDNCPYVYNPDQRDMDGDGVGDACDPDIDGDGVLNDEDAFPHDPTEWADSDGDGVGDNSDAFPYDPTEWADSDGDGLGDNADPDSTNKGPIPSITVSKSEAKTGEIINFNALKTRDPDGYVVRYEWDFGDGEFKEGVIVDHAFKKSGEYIVNLKVTDDKGEYRDQKIFIKIDHNPFFVALIITTILLIIMILGLLLPSSRFYYKKFRGFAVHKNTPSKIHRSGKVARKKN